MLLVGLLAAAPAQAQWPNDKPIELIVGFSPGGGTDVMARILARFAEKRLGGDTKIVVVNQPGAGGSIAAANIARAKPDGYTIGMVNVPGFIFLPLYKNTNYKATDLQLIARIVKDPIVFYSKRGSDVPQDLQGIVKKLAQDPESLTFGHSGDGTVGHIGLLQIQQEAGVLATSVPFKGGSETKSSLIGGHIDYALLTTGEVPDIDSSTSPFKALVQLSNKRMDRISNIPTAQEAGVDVAIASERGLAAPLNLPADIAERLEALVADVLQDPEFIAASQADAPVLDFLSGREWDAQLRKDEEFLKPLAENLKN